MLSAGVVARSDTDAPLHPTCRPASALNRSNRALWRAILYGDVLVQVTVWRKWRNPPRQGTKLARGVTENQPSTFWDKGGAPRGRTATAALEFSLHCIAHNLKWALRASPSGLVFAIARHLRRWWRLRITWPRKLTISRPDADTLRLLAA